MSDQPEIPQVAGGGGGAAAADAAAAADVAAVAAAASEEGLRAQHERIGAHFLKRTRAFGKLILFGEHFVVYKVPALVGAVSAYTDCEIEWTEEPGLQVVDNRPAVPRSVRPSVRPSVVLSARTVRTNILSFLVCFTHQHAQIVRPSTATLSCKCEIHAINQSTQQVQG